MNVVDAETFSILPVGIPSQYSSLVYNFSVIQLDFLNIKHLNLTVTVKVVVSLKFAGPTLGHSG